MAGQARLDVFFLALATALLLQILSNLANDYGDAMTGADAKDRLGPLRMVGSGLATPKQMFRAAVLAAALVLGFGLALVFVAAWNNPVLLIFFLLVGAASVLAAIMYTIGKRPYGYYGLGDFMAFLFFGPVAVWGSAVLCGAPFSLLLVLPGMAAGLCSTTILNVNNIRDIDTDRRIGKRTVAVRLGLTRAQRYHVCLTVLTVLSWAVFWLWQQPVFLPGLFLALPLARSTCRVVTRAGDAPCLNAQLKNTVLSSACLSTGMAALCIAAAHWKALCPPG